MSDTDDFRALKFYRRPLFIQFSFCRTMFFISSKEPNFVTDMSKP